MTFGDCEEMCHIFEDCEFGDCDFGDRDGCPKVDKRILLTF